MSARSVSKPVVALDFDGVLSDSLLEAYLLTWNIAGRVDPSLAHQLDKSPSIDAIREFRNCHRDHWDSFERIVPFGNRSEDYLVIQKAVEQQLSFSTQDEFNAFKHQVDQQFQDSFHQEFYLLRYDLAAKWHDLWLDLNAPYPGVRQALESLAGRYRLSIATSKDRETVIELLKSWGLFGHFGDQCILDKSAGESKRAHLRALREIFACDYREMTFIDDKVSHLIDCNGLGVWLLLAGWGYNGPLEHARAASEGFEILDIEQLHTLTA